MNNMLLQSQAEFCSHQIKILPTWGWERGRHSRTESHYEIDVVVWIIKKKMDNKIEAAKCT